MKAAVTVISEKNATVLFCPIVMMVGSLFSVPDEGRFMSEQVDSFMSERKGMRTLRGTTCGGCGGGDCLGAESCCTLLHVAQQRLCWSRSPR